MDAIYFNSYTPGYEWLSNFSRSPIVVRKLSFQTVEAAFHAMKTENAEEFKKFTGLNPKQARFLGRKVTLRPNWNEFRKKVMYGLLKRKFSIPRFRDKLLATGNAELIHQASWDNFWGNGKDGKGLNLLGQMLMYLRSKIREGAVAH